MNQDSTKAFMGIQNGITNRANFRPAAPRFAGGPASSHFNGLAGTGSSTPIETPDPLPKLGFFKTIRLTFSHLRQAMKEPQTRDVIKGFSLKHLPEMLMTGLCALPGVGWLANMIIVPISMKLTKTGGEILNRSEGKLKSEKDKELQKGLRQLIKLDRVWNNYNPKHKYFGSTKKQERTLPHYLADKYNKAIKGIFHKENSKESEALIHKLKVNIDNKKSFVYRHFEHWTNAGQAIRQTRVIGRVFNWMSGISKNVASKAFMSRFVRLFFLVPRVTLQGIYYLCRIKPKFPK